MLKITGFKVKKPRQYSYKPLYYDPEQEEVQQRKNARESRLSEEKYVHGSIVKNMRMERHNPVSSHNMKLELMNARKRKTLRLFIFLILLFVIGYIVFNSSFLEKLLLLFSGETGVQ